MKYESFGLVILIFSLQLFVEFWFMKQFITVVYLVGH